MNAGIIGYGYWGTKLVRNVIANKKLDLKKVVDIDPDRLRLLKKNHPQISSGLSPDDILNSKEIDCVIIATNPESHFELALKALENGKHVLVEKPVSTSPEKVVKLKGAAKSKGLILMTDLTFLYNGVVQKIKELIDEQCLGKILYIDSTRINHCTFQDEINVLWDLGMHDISIINYLLDDRPFSLSAIGRSDYFKGRENLAYLTLNYKHDIIAHIHCNWPSPVKVRQMKIGGDNKTLVFDDNASKEKIKIYNSGYHLKSSKQTADYEEFLNQKAIIPQYSTTEALKLMIEDFYQSVIHNKKPLADIDKTIDIVNILDSAQKSMDNGGKEIEIT